MVANCFECALQTLSAWKALRTTSGCYVFEDLKQGNTQLISEGTNGIPLDVETDALSDRLLLATALDPHEPKFASFADCRARIGLPF